MALEHFRFPEYSFDRLGRLYIFYVDLETLEVPKNAEDNVSYNAYRLAVKRKGLNIGMHFAYTPSPTMDTGAFFD